MSVVTSQCKSVPSIDYHTFSGVTATLMVPKGYANSYKASLWGESFSNILEIADYTTYTDLSEPVSANCYLVQEAGDYKFRAVKGNSTISVGDVAYAEVLWESLGTDIPPLEGYLIATAGYIDGDIVFSTPETFSRGNAVIAAKDASGKILWSWHIWCSDEGWTDQVYANNAGTMMDRNLGATSAKPGDVGALGLLYQWGRKDPFLGSSSILASLLAASTGNWGEVSGEQTVDYAVENPMTFIYDYEWCSSSTEDQRWMDSQKTMYDPCPAGYRVPKGGSDGFWAVSKVETQYDDTNKGLYWKLSNGELAWYPAAGLRDYDNGELNGVGSSGCYWSSTSLPSDDDGAFYLDFRNNGVVYPADRNSNYRGRGFSVRCLRE